MEPITVPRETHTWTAPIDLPWRATDPGCSDPVTATYSITCTATEPPDEALIDALVERHRPALERLARRP